MDAEWQQIFQKRMRGFRTLRPSTDEQAVSIKIRVSSGCFHREHSPHAYRLIDSQLASLPPDVHVEFVEHESGPEILAYLAAATAGLTLAKSVIDLITAILKARSEGVKKGDRADAPLELIVRSVDDGHEYREEIIFRIGHNQPVDPQAIEKQIEEALRKQSGHKGSSL